MIGVMGSLGNCVGRARTSQRLMIMLMNSFSVFSGHVVGISLEKGDKKCQFGLLTGNTIITMERAPDSTLLLIGKAVQGSRGAAGGMSIINPNWDFAQMGIGGLDKEFSDIFRRTFASRMFPPEVSQQLGMLTTSSL